MYQYGKNQVLRRQWTLGTQRFQLLDEIHSKQQSLDELDYMIGELEKGEG